MPRKNPSKQPSQTGTTQQRIRAARRVVGKKAHPAAHSVNFMERASYDAHINGMMAQGLDRADAVDTLKVGIRQANGRPVPAQLLAQAGMAA